MRAAFIFSLLTAGAAVSAAAADFDLAAATELAKATGCYSCHAAKEKIVGPAFSSIAEKYAGDKDAVDFHAILTPAFHPILTPPVGV